MKKKKNIFLAALALIVTFTIIGYNIEKRSNSEFVTETASNAEAEAYDACEDRITDGLININTADAELLDTLAGIGEITAQRIIDYREENGGFESIEEIMSVRGIGTEKFAAIKDKICCR